MYLRSLKLCMIATTLSSILPCQFWVILIKAGHNNGRQMTKMEGTGFSRQVLIHNLCQAWCIHASSDDHQLFSVWQESLNNKKSLYFLFFLLLVIWTFPQHLWIVAVWTCPWKCGVFCCCWSTAVQFVAFAWSNMCGMWMLTQYYYGCDLFMSVF